MAHTRQSRPDSGLGFQVKALKTFYGVPLSLGNGRTLGPEARRAWPRQALGGMVPFNDEA